MHREYEIRIAEPGRLWKVTHHAAKGDVMTYFVRRGTFGLGCNCPAARYHRGEHCKHAAFVANLIGRPELAGVGA